MAIFSEKVISAKFIDPPNNMLIELLYREGDTVVPYVLEVDFMQPDFTDLLKEISLEEIQNNTKNQLEAQRKEIYSAIDAEIERRWALEEEKIKEAYRNVDLYAEKERGKKLEEVQEEFRNLRNNLSAKFSTEIATNKLSPKDLFNQLFSMDQDKDFVFNLKISILEDTDIAKSKDKALKLSIRKAKTVTELLNIYTSFKG